MRIDKIRRCGIARVGLVVILAGLLASCAPQSEPAPVFQRGAAQPAGAPVTALLPVPSSVQITVRPGQSLGGVAQTYRVPKSAIIAANGLRPPYELKIGQRLTIPGSSAGGSVQQAMRPIAASPAVAPPTPLPPLQPAATPQPPPTPQTLGPPPVATKAQPEVIPLDGPPPPKQAATAPPFPAAATLTPPRSAQATLTPPQPAPPQAAAVPAAASPPVQPQASAEGAAGSGRFPWPVRGRILAGYGNTPGGGHNDGINIGAPRGTPVRSIDAGTVAYAGNEVKGYGNIVLIKHANGWISAYAHLDDVNVKPGDPIAAGQMIAKVGDSGGVAEPQLHFELRRGKQAVDPKEFLAPSPSAATPLGNKAG
jgi:murein DD-endopeptidase MepM/ murein hydrolase activator NlpD